MSDQPQDPSGDFPDPRAEMLRNFYGRVHGKTLRPAQKRYMVEDLPRYRLAGVTQAENPERSTLALSSVQPGSGPLWLEIGFGGGEHLVHMARAYREVRLIGCEPFVNGIAMALHKLGEAGHPGNVSIHAGDARDLLDVLPEASLERIFLNYPDPWPKARHHRRRFVTPEHLLPLARAAAPGAEFRIATDIPDYVRQALEEVPPAGFVLEAQSGTPWSDWISTRYEKKALREGRVPHYLTFRRP